LGHTNKWFRQEALRVLGDRRDRLIVPQLAEMMRTNTGQLGLESLWAVNLSGGFNERLAREALHHADPFVRLWTVRLLGDDDQVSGQMVRELVALAANEPNVEVRSQLACSARRLPASEALPIIRALLGRGE